MRKLGFALALLCVSATGALAQVKNLQDAPDLWVKHFQSGDIASLCRLYEPDAVFVGGNGVRNEGTKAIDAAFPRQSAPASHER